MRDYLTLTTDALRDEAQGTGLGRALTRPVIEAARYMGARRMVLDTFWLNVSKPAVRLYESEGFSPIAAYPESEIGTYPEFVGIGLFMEKVLE